MEHSAEVPAAARLHVLVVDNNEDLRYLVAAFLLYNGHIVDLAADGHEGWEKVQAEHFDVVITAQAMPGIRGDSLAAAIKMRAPETFVVLLTGCRKQQRTVTPLPAGVDFLAHSPIPWTALREALDTAVTRRCVDNMAPAPLSGRPEDANWGAGARTRNLHGTDWQREET